MKTDYYIERDRTLTPAQDYEFLRKEGLKYIENLSHRTWSDFNAHDPGITILEVLAYAITELGYRTNFDIENLLASKDGIIDNETFFTASNILINSALTEIDYRKLIIDIQGVNNAWLIPFKNEKDDLGYNLPLDNEVPIYINTKEDKLSLADKDKFDNLLNRLSIRGLNKVIVELSEDLELGDLNDVKFDFSWYDDGHFVNVEITTEFDTWSDPKAILLALMNEPSKIESVTTEIVDDYLKITTLRTLDNSQSLTLYIKPYDVSELPLVENYFDTEIIISKAIDHLAQKKVKVEEIFTEIQNTLNENRNLTENWLCVETINEIEIGVCTDIELDNEADAEEVMAKVQQAIDLILNSPIHFYTLNQMIDKGYDTREIFNGPALKHGFLIDEEIENAKLTDCIYASDIIAAIMDIKGVKSISNLLLTAYDSDGNPIESAKNKSWCLHLNGQQKPVLYYQKSKLLLFRDGIPFLLSEESNLEFNQGILYLKTENNNFKLEQPINDFLIPKAKHFQLDDYYSVQYEFPVTYSIGKGQLSEKATDLRKAQAKQLKAYLQHYDQLLADFFNQLYHAKELFDTKTIDKTYFPKYLTEIDGIDSDYFANEIYSAEFEATLLNGQNDTDRSLYESQKLFYNRRNRMLDHLLARFGESFNDYVFMMYKMQQNAQGIAGLTFQEEELIEDKQRFLRQYPELSSCRGLGINYLQGEAEEAEGFLKITKRGGYEKRIARLLGINNFNLEKIVAFEEAQTTWQYDTDLQFKLLNIVSSLTEEEKWELAQKLINDISSYKVIKFSKFYINFVNKDDKRIAKFVKEFDSYKEAEEYIPKLFQAINSCLENFYCIEHILLRPMTDDAFNDEDLLPVCLKDNCNSEANNDPYSFKVTLVLPGWLARFRNMYFRRYAQRICRQEAPAHTLIKVCWINREEMITFQDAYELWIKAYRKYKPKYCDNTLEDDEKEDYNIALANLVSELKELNTIYNEGTLYDCKESELDNPIILGNTSLGTL